MDADGIFQAVLARRQSQGSFTEDDYDDLIDEVIEEFMEDGLIDDDDDVELIKSDLRSRWNTIK